jgi:signal peptidase I
VSDVEDTPDGGDEPPRQEPNPPWWIPPSPIADEPAATPADERPAWTVGGNGPAPTVPVAPEEPAAPVAPIVPAAPPQAPAADRVPQPVAAGAGSAAVGAGAWEPPAAPDPPTWATAPPAPPPPATPPAPPHPDEHPPHGQSRNPVDRLTRGLPHPLRVTIDWIVTIVGAVVIVLLVKAYVVNPYRIPSSSMEPTLHCARPELGCEARYSDRVLANRFLYHLRDPRRGEIIVFKTPPEAQIKCGAGGTFVKRLIGLPGDTVEVRVRSGSGYVYINGKPLNEPYIQASRRTAMQPFGPVKVKPSNYFMMGDNRSQSCDSRQWGTVPRQNLIGKVFATYWPPNRISLH